MSDEDLDNWDNAVACYLDRKTTLPCVAQVLVFDLTEIEQTDAIRPDVKCQTGVPADRYALHFYMLGYDELNISP